MYCIYHTSIISFINYHEEYNYLLLLLRVLLFLQDNTINTQQLTTTTQSANVEKNNNLPSNKQQLTKQQHDVADLQALQHLLGQGEREKGKKREK